jgi:signal transduction histidine kinase
MQGQAMHGVEICARARALRPDLVTMIITAYADDVAAAIDAINRGQVRAYLPKPWTEQLADVLEVTIARMHETKTARELGIDMLRAHPEQVKLTVLEQVAHDVLNPLNTARLHHARAKQLLQAAGERLGARGDGEIAAVLAGAAQHQSDSLAAMDQVVEVAARYRPEGPHRRPPTERCDVADVVASVVAYLRAEVERTATLSTAIESAPTVRMDRTALARVVANLLLNAAQAMAEKPGGAITVEVCAAKDRWWCVDDDVWYCNTCSGCCPGGCPP